MNIRFLRLIVTPFTGVWIEIFRHFQFSPPQGAVTPFTGVWIEMDLLVHQSKNYASHTLHGCVD